MSDTMPTYERDFSRPHHHRREKLPLRVRLRWVFWDHASSMLLGFTFGFMLGFVVSMAVVVHVMQSPEVVDSFATPAELEARKR